MKLNTERYKGVAIQVTKKVNPAGVSKANEVLARFRLKGNPYVYTGDTKETAVMLAKKAIDKIL